MAVKEIGMGECESGSGSDRLETVALATCIRIAIVGDYPAHAQAPPGSPDRFLAHVVEAKDRPVELADLIAEVQDAVADGLTNLRATVVLSTPDTLGLNTSGAADDGTEVQIEKLIEEQEDQNDRVLADVENLVGEENVVEVYHSCEEEWKLVITSTKQIQYGKQ